jgi:hypothetical protein
VKQCPRRRAKRRERGKREAVSAKTRQTPRARQSRSIVGEYAPNARLYNCNQICPKRLVNKYITAEMALKRTVNRIVESNRA